MTGLVLLLSEIKGWGGGEGWGTLEFFPKKVLALPFILFKIALTPPPLIVQDGQSNMQQQETEETIRESRTSIYGQKRPRVLPENYVPI